MTAEEVRDFLAEQRIVSVATLGRDGWPHVTALWYVLRDGEPWIFTYAKSQKVRNLERDDRATLLVEAGHSYDELRGVMLAARARIHRDLDTVAAVGEELSGRYGVISQEDGASGSNEAARARAAKRVAVRFEVVRTASWDHSRLVAPG